MHLFVGNRIKEFHGGVVDLPRYYLGCVYPDCVNAFGFAPKEVRYPAHLRVMDIDEWVANCRSFYRENACVMDADFLLGYMVHCATDAMYDRHFNDIDRVEWARFDYLHAQSAWWRDEVLLALKQAASLAENSANHCPSLLATHNFGPDAEHIGAFLRKHTTEAFNPTTAPVEATDAIITELAAIVWGIVKEWDLCTK